MSPAASLILLEYDEYKNCFSELGKVVYDFIFQKMKELDIHFLSLDQRIKSEESLKRKLALKDGKYNTLYDITDILGVRIITMYSDEVDKVAQLLQEIFEIDWKNSVDKRKTLGVREFGYVSLHYICALKKDNPAYTQFEGIRFEIQIRTQMQHIWSEINHDIGYKSDFTLPTSCMRSFSRLASLMEIADDMACNLRNDISEYLASVNEKIAKDEADDIEINRVSILEYAKNNGTIQNFLDEFEKICKINRIAFDPDSLIKNLDWFGFKTLGDVKNLFIKNQELALKYAEHVFKTMETEIVTSSVALRFIFNAELMRKNFTLEQILSFYSIAIRDKSRARIRAEDLLEFKKNQK
ncbi:MAG: RelA/SpoT domain-containing protein [Treponema sp.]|nr:RelA/SpoT domain-containing protein [Candidatus Treponema equifaecale]